MTKPNGDDLLAEQISLTNTSPEAGQQFSFVHDRVTNPMRNCTSERGSTTTTSAAFFFEFCLAVAEVTLPAIHDPTLLFST